MMKSGAFPVFKFGVPKFKWSVISKLNSCVAKLDPERVEVGTNLGVRNFLGQAPAPETPLRVEFGVVLALKYVYALTRLISRPY